jgi:hypothetical protein
MKAVFVKSNYLEVVRKDGLSIKLEVIKAKSILEADIGQ